MQLNHAQKLLTIATTSLLAVASGTANGQGIGSDAAGHATLNGRPILACWNFEAGGKLAEDYSRYPEFLPNLRGWDFRINLPHTHFQHARTYAGAAAATLVGVQESDATVAARTLADYGHINNSIWVFQVDPTNGRMNAKVVPSRRDEAGRATTNIISLGGNWLKVGSSGPAFIVERPAVAVVGEGRGVARIFVVARDETGELHMTSHIVAGNEEVGDFDPVLSPGRVAAQSIFDGIWQAAWTPLGYTSSVAPSLSPAFDGKIALASIDARTKELQVRSYTPASNSWSPPTPIPDAETRSPQLIWDGTALNLFFVNGGAPTLQQAYALSDAPLRFFARRPVSSLVAVYEDQFHAMFFNRRLHVVIRQDDGSDEGPVFYTVSLTDPGRPASWAIPSETGIVTNTAPRVAWMYENIVVIGTFAGGRVRYVRKDPNAPGNAETGAALADRWLDPGLDVDPTANGAFSGLAVLTFNSDVYLAANSTGGGNQPAGLYLVNFSRSVLKRLITQKWGMRLLWGEPGGGRMIRPGDFAGANEVPALADLNGDGQDDLIRFSQVPTPDGEAPVYIHRNVMGDFISPQVSVASFARPGHVPMVGDFDGNGSDDIITFAQQPEYDFEGTLIGTAPVYVGLNNGNQSGIKMWHDWFSPAPEVPHVGDVNGDGMDDIISFAQFPLTDFDGGLIALAPVWVALSDGTNFGEKMIWHDSFSFPGEIPMVGDFNGDGSSDIVTFVQQAQNGVGTAPVYVALSNDSAFVNASVWHTFFAPQPEVPQVFDMNMDGRDDILTFLADKPGAGDAARSIFVAFSSGARFERSTTWHSDFITSNQVRRGPANRVYSPLIGHIGTNNGPRSRASWTGVAADVEHVVPDVLAFGNDGSVWVARTMANVPFPSGAPWERYKFFTDKGIGVALFPEWIYEGPAHCIAGNHRFGLNGAAGVGGTDLTISSARFGGRSGHVLEELGHSIFANCFRSNRDTFGLYQSIFELSTAQGGIGAAINGPVEALPGCPDPNGFLSCRPDSPGEHYFLQLLSRYRLNPEFFRRRIAEETNPSLQSALAVQYQWLKDNWFDGMEFATGAPAHASLEQPGVPLLPAALPPIDCDADPAACGVGQPGGGGSGECGSGAACGAGVQLPLLLMMLPVRRFRRRNATRGESVEISRIA